MGRGVSRRGCAWFAPPDAYDSSLARSTFGVADRNRYPPDLPPRSRPIGVVA